MAHRNDPLGAGVHTTHAWLNAVADELGTEDRQFAFRALRAWMHTVRDRIGVRSYRSPGRSPERWTNSSRPAN